MWLEPSWITTNSTVWSRTVCQLTSKGKTPDDEDESNFSFQDSTNTSLWMSLWVYPFSGLNWVDDFFLQFGAEAPPRWSKWKGQRCRQWHSRQRGGDTPGCQTLPDRQTDRCKLNMFKVWNVIARGFFTLHWPQKLHISPTWKNFAHPDLSNRRMKSSCRTKIRHGSSWVSWLQAVWLSVWTTDSQLLTDLNQGLYSEQLFIFK